MDTNSRWPRRSRTLLAAVAGLTTTCLGGCATHKGESFRPAFLEGEQNVVYIFRSPSALNGSKVDVFVNQQKVATLRAGEHVAYVAGPGEYLVRVEAASSSVARVRLVGGESVYLSIAAAGINPTPKIEVLQENEGLAGVSETHAAEEGLPGAAAPEEPSR